MGYAPDHKHEMTPLAWFLLERGGTNRQIEGRWVMELGPIEYGWLESQIRSVGAIPRTDIELAKAGYENIVFVDRVYVVGEKEIGGHEAIERWKDLCAG